MIEVKQLTKKYTSKTGTVTALDNINLHIPAGSIFGIIGASGAGKSTLIRCLNLLEQPTSGEVIVDGQNLLKLSTHELNQTRHKIGMIFQHFNLLNSRTVWQNIALPLELIHLPKAEQQQRINRLLELTDLTDKRDAYPNQLSGGQKQRVAIARALATEPKVLLCDEATSALDPQMTQSILALLKDINKRLNLTIVLITHQMQVIKTICDQVAVIEKGKIIDQGRTAETQTFVNTVLNLELSDAIRQRLAKQQQPSHRLPLWRLTFSGRMTAEPLITHLVRELALDINILQANIEHIQDHMLGMMVVEALGDEQQLEQGMIYLRNNGVETEVIGYVA